jgi:protocatechuate 3,4-dioxygenase alpha subunit
MTLQATTWQTVGPFFQIGMAWLYRDALAGPGVAGERVEISGQVLDGDGKTVPDAVLETWQADAAGRYAHPEDLRQAADGKGFTGFGRFPTDQAGRFRFTTIKPGRVAGPASGGGAAADSRASAALMDVGMGAGIMDAATNAALLAGMAGGDRSSGSEGLQAPHIAVSVLTRGLLRRLVTRIYFPDEPGNAEDFALGLVEAGRRGTLIARKVAGRAGALEWNVVLQGAGETVFFDL